MKYQNQTSEYYSFTRYLYTMFVPHGNRLNVWEQRIMGIFSHKEEEEEVAMNAEEWLRSLILGYISADIVTANKLMSINLAGHIART